MSEPDLATLAKEYLEIERKGLLSRRDLHTVTRKSHESRTIRDAQRSKERRAKNKARAVKRAHRTTKKKHGRQKP